MKKLTNTNAAKEFVRDRADLFQLIKEDIGDREWKQEGNNTWVTLSPFRDETKPSFKVSHKKWKDWGGEQYGGDAFAWAQLWHGLRFEESIIYVADKLQIDITQFLRDPTPEELQISRYKQINALAAEYMHQLLKDNIIVRDNYLARSCFTLDIIAPYQVGYCPNKEVLITHLANNIRLTDDDLNKLEFNRADLFTNALIYPVHNHSGEVINFRTRKLDPEDSPYMGMRTEHPLHDPSVLYGFHVAKKYLRSNGGQLVIVEGQRDTIALKAAGVMGASLREKQIEAIKQYKVRKLVICYDSDETGWRNTLELISDPPDFGSMLVLIARPDWVTDELDVDPHDIWRVGGNEAVHAMLQKAVLPIEYYITTNYGKVGQLSITDKYKLLTDLKEYLNQVTGTHLDMTAAYLAQILESKQENVLDYVTEIKANYSQLFNLEAEKVLIYYCMTNSVSYNSTISAGIKKGAFTLSQYQKLYDACDIAYKKFGANYSAQNVLDEAMARFASPELPTTVSSVIMDGKYKYTEPAACEMVLDMYRRRLASEQASKLITSSRDLSKSFSEVINEHRRILVDSVSSGKPQARTPRELSDEFYGILKERERNGGNLIIGYNYYDLPSINLILGGIQQHYTVIAGDTGAGKSLFAMNMLKCIAIDQKVPCMWVGQEMFSGENTSRLVSIMTGINNTRLQAGCLTQKEAKMVAEAKEIIASSGYHYARPPDGTIDEIVALVDEYIFKFGIKVVFWDYIQLVVQAQWQSRLSREQIIGHASKVIRNKFVSDMCLAAVIVAQLNRSENNMKSTQRIAGSYQISQDCDNFLEIIEKTKKQMVDDGIQNGNRYIKVGKRRGGISSTMINSYLDTEVGNATLRLTECTLPSDQAALYSKLSPTIGA